jgi:hypothetical protein
MPTGGPPTFHAGTYDGVTMRLYANGVMVNSVASSRVQADSSTRFTVGGASFSASSSWNGGIQEAAVWNRTLSDDEIECLWRAAH